MDDKIMVQFVLLEAVPGDMYESSPIGVAKSETRTAAGPTVLNSGKQRHVSIFCCVAYLPLR